VSDAAAEGVAEPATDSASADEAIGRLVDQAQAEGLSLTGPGGLLGELTKRVLESALEGEMDGHLGYARHDPAGRNGGNSRNGHRTKTVLTESGPIDVDVPRDRDSSFEPRIVRKRQSRLTGVDDLVISLSAKGLTHGEIVAHLREVYGAEVSKATITAITDRVVEDMVEWQNRPLDPVYPVVFVDAIHVKYRDGQVANHPIYVALAVTVDGERDILGLWAGDGGEGAKYWLHVLTELRNRGVGDVLIVVCDGLKGLPDGVSQTWPQTVVQTCVVHLLRNSFRYASRRDWPAIARDLRPVYQAATEQAALDAFAEFAKTWEVRYPVRALPGLRPRDPHHHLHDERDRVAQRPVPPGGQGPRALPVRAGRAEVPLSGDPQPGPHRRRPPALDQPLEESTQRVRHHLRRPTHSRPPLTPNKPVTPLA
jgi:putative transposase